jgi:sugar phosphate isomerase/epimerase
MNTTPKRSFVKGISTVCLSKQPFDEALIDLLSQKAISVIELSDYHPRFSYDLDSIQSFSRILANKGIKVSTLHTHVEEKIPGVSLSAANGSMRAKTITVYQQAIDCLAMLNGDILVTHDIGIAESDRPQDDHEYIALIDNLRRLADYAGSKGIRIALENTTTTITCKAAAHRSLVEAIGHEHVGCCVDTGHANLNQNVAEFIEIIGSYLITLHIHDNKGKSDNHQMPGWGNIDWPSVIDSLAAVDYTGIFMYEVMPTEILDVWQTNLANLVSHREHDSVDHY